MEKTALIVGAGKGISASFARRLAKDGYKVILTARQPDKLAALAEETGASVYPCDAARRADTAELFARLDQDEAPLDLVLYNPSYRTRGPFVELDPAEVETALMVTAYGGFLVGQQAAQRMLKRGRGAILFTGASASVKGYPQSAPFAMGKFALRGLAQSMARELAPGNVHVAHFVIDGGVRSAARVESTDKPDSMLDPDAIAETMCFVLKQPRNAWSWEIELRPWVEKF